MQSDMLSVKAEYVIGKDMCELLNHSSRHSSVRLRMYELVELFSE